MWLKLKQLNLLKKLFSLFVYFKTIYPFYNCFMLLSVILRKNLNDLIPLQDCFKFKTRFVTNTCTQKQVVNEFNFFPAVPIFSPNLCHQVIAIVIQTTFNSTLEPKQNYPQDQPFSHDNCHHSLSVSFSIRHQIMSINKTPMK